MFGNLTGKPVLEGFAMFPPFNADCGLAISIGKNVFINSGCKFQDQGGIIIGDGSLIGHNVVIATLNHDLDPSKRGDMHPSSVVLGSNVWIGSNATILPGVTIGDGAVVAKDVSPRTVVGGIPAKFIKDI